MIHISLELLFPFYITREIKYLRILWFSPLLSLNFFHLSLSFHFSSVIPLSSWRCLFLFSRIFHPVVLLPIAPHFVGLFLCLLSLALLINISISFCCYFLYLILLIFFPIHSRYPATSSLAFISVVMILQQFFFVNYRISCSLCHNTLH